MKESKKLLDYARWFVLDHFSEIGKPHFRSNHVPADLMNDNVEETYKNLNQRIF